MTFSISDAATQAGVTIHTLHYYEREGLIHVSRASSGHRRYSSHDLEWIGILTCLRKTGMPIRTMREFAALVQQDSSNIAQRIRILEAHRLEVIDHLKSLQHNLLHVEYKIDYYQKVLAQNAIDLV
jgi:DNA-binding transcriptional MerR regulator